MDGWYFLAALCLYAYVATPLFGHTRASPRLFQSRKPRRAFHLVSACTARQLVRDGEPTPPIETQKEAVCRVLRCRVRSRGP